MATRNHIENPFEYLIHGLKDIMRTSAGVIRDVRGRGLWVGVDIEPSHASARELVERLASRGVLSKETHETVIRFAPPLTITHALIDRALDAFRQVVESKCAEVARGKAREPVPA